MVGKAISPSTCSSFHLKKADVAREIGECLEG